MHAQGKHHSMKLLGSKLAGSCLNSFLFKSCVHKGNAANAMNSQQLASCTLCSVLGSHFWDDLSCIPCKSCSWQTCCAHQDVGQLGQAWQALIELLLHLAESSSAFSWPVVPLLQLLFAAAAAAAAAAILELKRGSSTIANCSLQHDSRIRIRSGNRQTNANRCQLGNRLEEQSVQGMLEYQVIEEGLQLKYKVKSTTASILMLYKKRYRSHVRTQCDIC